MIGDEDSDHPDAELPACKVSECGTMHWNWGRAVRIVFFFNLLCRS